MAKSHITTSRDRASRKYADKHDQLRAEVKARQVGIKSDKAMRSYVKSELFRRHGETIESAF